jgi:hypothetical protein
MSQTKTAVRMELTHLRSWVARMDPGSPELFHQKSLMHNGKP